MNWVETAVVNSPPRRWLQRLYETPTLILLGGHLDTGSRAVEIDCGSGDLRALAWLTRIRGDYLLGAASKNRPVEL